LKINKALAAFLVPIESVRPDPKNARLHSERNILAIMESLKKFGQQKPIVIHKGFTLAGAGTLEAAKRLKWEKIAAIPFDQKEAQAMGYKVSDNRSAELAEWDIPQLSQDLKFLESLKFDLDSLGWSERDLNEQLKIVNYQVSDSDDEIVDRVPNPKTKAGDLYVFGKHRLLCGDCLEPKNVEKLMNGEKAALMNTDPPYGVNYGDIANSRLRAVKNKNDYKQQPFPDIKNDDLDGEKLQLFLENSIRAALPFLINNPAFYLWHPMLTQGTFFAAAAAAADILIHRQIIWVKPSLIMGRGDYHWRHELCFYGWIKGKRPAWLRGRDQDTVWEVGRENDKIHPTQKPAELFIRPILNHTKKGEVVYEPFAGSGTQFIAAEITGRACYGLEIDPGYCDTIINRWEKKTGKKAQLIKGK